MPECILCHHRSIEEISDAQPGSYYHCRECDLIFLDPSLRLSSEAEKVHYQTHNNTLDNPGYVQMFEEFLTGYFLPYARSGSAVLDYGCGPGPVLQTLLQRRGFHADIYDPYFAPQLPTGTYEAITCTEALEHTFRPLLVWQTFDCLLRPGGILALMTHFHSGPGKFAAWWYRRDPTHVVFFSEKTFVHVAAACGYTILATDHKKTLTMKKWDK